MWLVVWPIPAATHPTGFILVQIIPNYTLKPCDIHTFLADSLWIYAHYQTHISLLTQSRSDVNNLNIVHNKHCTYQLSALNPHKGHQDGMRDCINTEHIIWNESHRYKKCCENMHNYYYVQQEHVHLTSNTCSHHVYLVLTPEMMLGNITYGSTK